MSFFFSGKTFSKFDRVGRVFYVAVEIFSLYFLQNNYMEIGNFKKQLNKCTNIFK